ncbi:hypothetical protein HBH56_152410 [Parastagonospora nodorum]|uniref:Uncharacterized protein n=1 Tax=Phaeosphaeria nodorum (strain SN15 / ATCC MYA-4574 / FGSC 10173) TaxID=321614 RepID=A0A7U2F1V5_PHANO|nr:hypothetical protein HBH56_152410 [Parastagonospora nodorum]QRC96093.1 hypothetical protein JI435_408300 [Parastagonospora nodorum SN15]KAH3926814.1 hypothetical protein HBH54_165270 [Parastagonospora nodorum]KAH3970251.1 hypothetical protein HBH52_165600 [Parastagonospora nodorum]KAH3971956.1 hypothetical protein HBH51_107580 [Parastagonospora nodorum]
MILMGYTAGKLSLLHAPSITLQLLFCQAVKHDTKHSRSGHINPSRARAQRDETSSYHSVLSPSELCHPSFVPQMLMNSVHLPIPEVNVTTEPCPWDSIAMLATPRLSLHSRQGV